MTGAKAPAEAASALCNAMPGLLEPSRPAALRQSALAALGTAASAFGRQHPTPFLGALPAALAAAQVRDALFGLPLSSQISKCSDVVGCW